MTDGVLIFLMTPDDALCAVMQYLLNSYFKKILVYGKKRFTSNLISVIFSFLMEETSKNSVITLPKNSR